MITGSVDRVLAMQREIEELTAQLAAAEAASGYKTIQRDYGVSLADHITKAIGLPRTQDVVDILELGKRLRDTEAQLADKRERVTRLEAELQGAAATLQETLPIGQCKAIGLLEVATGVKELAALQVAKLAAAEEREAAMREALEQYRDARSEAYGHMFFLTDGLGATEAKAWVKVLALLSPAAGQEESQ